MPDILVKVLAGVTICILFILILFGLVCLYSAIQSFLYDDYSIMLPPYKNDWVYNWIVHSKDVNDDSIVNYKIYTYECPKCRYISDVSSRCCPDCGCYFSNYDLNWQSKLKVNGGREG